MGYSMSKFQIDSEMYTRGENAGRGHHEQDLSSLDHEIAHETKFRSTPNEKICKVTPCKKRNLPISPVEMLTAREANYSGRGRFSKADRCHVSFRYLPIYGPCRVDKLSNNSSKAYISQFSPDGSLFIAGFQDSQIRIYNVDNGWRIQKNILAKSLRWTISDTSLSPDQRYLVYSSMSPVVHIVNVESASTHSYANINEIHDGLDFSMEENNVTFSIFSVKFSTDGRELVAGAGDDCIYVYDLEANKVTLRIAAHTCDVNAVVFADETGHLIYSGSDDKLCKVWDRRCFNGRGRAAGVLAGHLEGITFLDTRADGRYFISNGKDQTIKLWDIRKMASSAPRISRELWKYEWDYRWDDYPYSEDLKHPCDQSVATYRGHSVLRTLIRCYFSPSYSTGQKYIYTGSNDGNVYIYDVVSGAIAAKLEYHETTVRDCSWHPFYPMLVSSSWDRSVARWEFPGDGNAPTSVHKKLRRRRTRF